MAQDERRRGGAEHAEPVENDDGLVVREGRNGTVLTIAVGRAHDGLSDAPCGFATGAPYRFATPAPPNRGDDAVALTTRTGDERIRSESAIGDSRERKLNGLLSRDVAFPSASTR